MTLKKKRLTSSSSTFDSIRCFADAKEATLARTLPCLVVLNDCTSLESETISAGAQLGFTLMHCHLLLLNSSKKSYGCKRVNVLDL